MQDLDDRKDTPWIFAIDNIFVDVAREFPNNSILEENNIEPGTQNTAFTEKDKNFAIQIIQMKDGEYGSKELSSTPGGCAMNTCRSANFYLQSLPGGGLNHKVVTSGSIGKDDGGNYILNKTKEEGIVNQIYVDDEAITGQCAVTVVEADRTCIAILDACEKYPTKYLQELLLKQEIKNCVCFYSTAFFVQSNWEALMMMAKFTLEHNKIMSFNFASESIYGSCKDQVIEIMQYSDFMFCNYQEAMACGKCLGKELGLETEEQQNNINDIVSALSQSSHLNQKRQKIMIVTNSGDPVTISIYSPQSKTVDNFNVNCKPLKKEQVLDSNGAGDSFVGGFLAKISMIEASKNYKEDSIIEYSRQDITEAVQAGNLMAREVVQRYGCTFPSIDNIRELLRE